MYCSNVIEINSIKYIYIYKGISDNQICLLRVLGETSQVEIPALIDGKKVTVIGEYCFSTKNNLDELSIEQINKIEKDNQGIMHLLCGDMIESVKLPESVTTLERCAFYNCQRLNKIIVGSGLVDIYSDVFMNCSRLTEIEINGSVLKHTGLKFLLSQLTGDITVTFKIGMSVIDENHIVSEKSRIEKGEIECRLFFPEYTENYEEVGPAHIFALNVDGEGYRVRQMFSAGVFELSNYDGRFFNIAAVENFETTALIAVNRLMYPIGLQDISCKNYEKFIKENDSKIVDRFIEMQWLEALEMVYDMKLADKQILNHAVEEAVAKGWTEGSAALLRIKQKYLKKTELYADKYVF